MKAGGTAQKTYFFFVLGLIFFGFLLFGQPARVQAEEVAATSSPYQIGYHCAPHAESFFDGGYFEHSGVSCVYNASLLPGPAFRFGDVYRGVIGSSTLVNGHSLGTSDVSVHNFDLPPDPRQGEDFFVAIYTVRHSADLNAFRDHFLNGGALPVDNEIYGFLRFKWGIAPTTTPSCTENCYSNVLFLPGYKGSVLQKADDTLWPPTLYSEDVLRLALDSNGNSTETGVVASDIVDSFYTAEIYASLRAHMDGLVAADTISAWKPYPYDWRLSIEKTLMEGTATPTGRKDLVAEVENLAELSRTGKVTIVAHSNGGLLGKALIEKLRLESKADLVDAFVMIGTPQLGTPKAVATLLHGEGEDLALGIITDRSKVRFVAKNMESAYNLLPSSQYLERVNDPVISFDDTTPLTHQWRERWGLALGNFEEYLEFLTGQGPNRLPPSNDDFLTPAVLRGDLLAESEEFHQTFDNYTFPDNIRVVQIVGWGLETIKGIRYTEDGGTLDYRPILTREGDETVVYTSAFASVGESYYVNLFDYAEVNSKARHRKLAGIPPVTSVLDAVIRDAQVSIPEFVTTVKPAVSELEEMLLVSVHSPVSLRVQNDQNQFTGIAESPFPGTDMFPIEEGIPGSTYMQFGHGKYISLKEGSGYTALFEGTGYGTATVEVARLSGDLASTTAVYSDIPIRPETKATLLLNGSGTSEVLEVDEDGDGDGDLVVFANGMEPSLSDLLQKLKETVNSLDLKASLKKNLLKRVEKLEEKLTKAKVNQVSKKLFTLTVKINQNVGEKGLTGEDAEVLLELLESIKQEL